MYMYTAKQQGIMKQAKYINLQAVLYLAFFIFYSLCQISAEQPEKNKKISFIISFFW